MDTLVGYDIVVPFTFMVNGQPKIPTSGTVKYTVYGHNGVALVGLTDVNVTTGIATTSVSISIPSANATIAVGKRFETRNIIVQAMIEGKLQLFQKKVRVVPYLNHSVSPEQVRSYIGLNFSELPDDAIDLFNAYLALENRTSEASLTSALSSGTFLEQRANEAIKLQAVIDLIPSLKQRLAQSQTNGLVAFTRPNNIDFDGMLDTATSRYADLVSAITNVAVTTPTLLVFNNPTDPVTGA